MKNPFSRPPKPCRGAARAARRREKHKNTAWLRANDRSAPFRMKIVERIEKMRREWLALQKTKKVKAEA